MTLFGMLIIFLFSLATPRDKITRRFMDAFYPSREGKLHLYIVAFQDPIFVNTNQGSH